MSFLTIAKKTIFTPRLFSSSPATPNPTFTVNDYLVSAFGIAPATAVRISKTISYLKSPRNPDAVRSFLQRQGFTEAEIKTIVTLQPNILCSSPENTLGTNLRALRNMDLSTSTLTRIILSGPAALQLDSAVHKINFCGNEAALVRVFTCNRGLISHAVNGGIATKISLLQSYGICITDIQRILWKVPSFMTSRVSKMEDMLKRAIELGFHPQSRMFVNGLVAMASTREAVQKKMELLKSFGLSEEELLSAVQKYPVMLCLSEENLQIKMEFLLGEAKCDISYIIFRPMILSFSLEKRLRPRHHVLNLLELKGLSDKKIEFRHAIELTESKFVERYILPHEETIPELKEVYPPTCSSRSG